MGFSYTPLHTIGGLINSTIDPTGRSASAPFKLIQYSSVHNTVHYAATMFHCTGDIRGYIQKFPDWPPGARTVNGTALCHQIQFYRYFVSQSSEFCRHKPLRCFSTSVYCGQLHDPVIFNPEKRVPGTHWIRGWVGHRAGLYAALSLPESNPGRPVCL
jgi:hypothetical protein